MAKPTIRDVARLAGVSRKSVSFALNGLGGTSPATRERIEAAIATLGYVPSRQARSLATGRSGLIALLHDGTDPILAGRIEAGMLAALEGSGRALLVQVRQSGDTASTLQFLDAQAPDGVVLAPALAQQDALIAAIRAQGTPLARLAHAEPPDDPRGVAWSNDRQGAADALGYLIALGHRRIGFIAGPENHPAMRARESGFLAALAEHRLDTGAEIIVQGDGSFASGMAAARLLFELSPRPSAIFAASDTMAAGAHHAALGAKIAVPEAMSIIGFGDESAAPAISTIGLAAFAMARAATRWLIDPSAMPEAGLAFAAELIVRGTTAPAPA